MSSEDRQHRAGYAGRDRRSVPSHRRVLATLAPAIVAWACVGPPELPEAAPPPEPFARYPYVQAVSESTASVVWMTTRPTADTLLYLVSGSEDTVRIIEATPATRHRVDLRGLPPDTRVEYQVRSSTGGSARGSARGPPAPGSSAVHGFRTAPVRGSEAELTVLVWGDSGWGSPGQEELARRMKAFDFDLALHTGDMAYEEGSDYAFTHRFFRVYRHMLAGTPVFPTPGNHDLRTDGGRPFDEAFVLPGGAERERRRYYSFDWGRVHFVAIDSNGGEESASDIREGGPQYRWLACDLARAAADERTDWIVAYVHHPPYSAAFGPSAHGSDEDLGAMITDVFDRHRVDIAFSGHDHHYERSWPIRNEQVDSVTPGTVYVVTGGGGASLKWRGVETAWHTAVSERAYHFVVLRVGTGSLRIEAIDANGALIDAHEIAPKARTDRRPDRVIVGDSRPAAGCPLE